MRKEPCGVELLHSTPSTEELDLWGKATGTQCHTNYSPSIQSLSGAGLPPRGEFDGQYVYRCGEQLD
ncbi:unnamed protein product [Arctogadus glacialis]